MDVVIPCGCFPSKNRRLVRVTAFIYIYYTRVIVRQTPGQRGVFERDRASKSLRRSLASRRARSGTGVWPAVAGREFRDKRSGAVHRRR